MLQLSSCINKLKDRINQEKLKNTPFAQMNLTDDFPKTRDDILLTYKKLDKEDFDYFRFIISNMRSNKKQFIEEMDRRYKLCEAKYKRPKIGKFNVFFRLFVHVLPIVHTDEVDPIKANRILLNYNYIVSEVAQMIDSEVRIFKFMWA